MKNISISCFFILFLVTTSLFAQNTEGGSGIEFIHEKYADALAKAKVENKIVFMDAYTTWCGPCKLMSKKVFTEASVAAFYNEKFINLKLDMERGEGVAALQRYGIQGFPTLLFLNGDGDVIHKSLGYLDAAQFLELGKTALTSDETVGAWTSRFEKGDREPKFLQSFAEKLGEAYDPRRQEIAEAYLKTQTDWQTPNNLAFIFRFTEGVDSPLFGYLVKEQKAFEKKFTKDEIQLKIQELVSDLLNNENRLPTLVKADSVLKMVYTEPKDFQRRSMNYRLMHARLSGDRARYAESAIVFFKKYDDKAEELSETAATFYEVIDEPKHLAKAVKWAKRSVKLEKRFLNQIVVAQLYDKIGKKSKALKEAQKAIDLAKITGENYDEATELIKELGKK